MELRQNYVRIVDDSNIIVDEQIPSEYSFALGKNNSNPEFSNYIELSQELKDKLMLSPLATPTYIASSEEASQALESIKGKYSVLYKKVDIYNNQFIDVKMTVMDFSASGIAIEGTNNPEDSAFMFNKDQMGIWSSGIRWVTIKYEFFKSGTNEPIYVKGNTTYWDVDAYQGVIIHDNNMGLYTTSCDDAIEGNECMLFSNSKNNIKYIFSRTTYDDKTNDRRYSFSEIFEGYSLTRTYQYGIPSVPNWKSQGGYIGNSSELSMPSDLGPAQKYASSEKVGLNDEIVYSLNQSVPLLLPQFYLKSLVLEDELDDVLNVNINNVSIQNELGENVIDLFELEQDHQKIILRAKDTSDSNLYGHTYIIKIKAKINEEKLLKNKQGNKYVLSNQVSTSYVNYNDNSEQLKSNVVNITYEDEPQIVEVEPTGINNYILIIIGGLMFGIGMFVFYKNKV